MCPPPPACPNRASTLRTVPGDGTCGTEVPSASSATSLRHEKATEAQGGKACQGHPLLNLPPGRRPQTAPSHAEHRADASQSPHTLASATYTQHTWQLFNQWPQRPQSGLSSPNINPPAPAASCMPLIVPGNPQHPPHRSNRGLQITQSAPSPPRTSYLGVGEGLPGAAGTAKSWTSIHSLSPLDKSLKR